MTPFPLGPVMGVTSMDGQRMVVVARGTKVVSGGGRGMVGLLLLLLVVVVVVVFDLENFFSFFF